MQNEQNRSIITSPSIHVTYKWVLLITTFLFKTDYKLSFCLLNIKIKMWTCVLCLTSIFSKNMPTLINKMGKPRLPINRENVLRYTMASQTKDLLQESIIAVNLKGSFADQKNKIIVFCSK